MRMPTDPERDDKPCDHCERCDPDTCPMGNDWYQDHWEELHADPVEETCMHGVPLHTECVDCMIDEYEHPDEDQVSAGWRPRQVSYSYWADDPAAARY